MLPEIARDQDLRLSRQRRKDDRWRSSAAHSYSPETASQHRVLETVFGEPLLECPLDRIRNLNLGLTQVNLAHR